MHTRRRLLPMLTLGIPGSPTAAVLLGGLVIWGLQPGPMLFAENKDFDPIIVDPSRSELCIEGIAVGLIRNLVS